MIDDFVQDRQSYWSRMEEGYWCSLVPGRLKIIIGVVARKFAQCDCFGVNLIWYDIIIKIGLANSWGPHRDLFSHTVL
jgi:hypothetical protein